MNILLLCTINKIENEGLTFLSNPYKIMSNQLSD